MRNVKCPFCGEPCIRHGIRNTNISHVFRCGTIGPDENDEYQTGHTCDIMMYNRLLDEKDKEIKRLKKTMLKRVDRFF